ncbi:hypothetical protein BDD12DRAFT_882254 [Trichophaea hybrida]|nr:hypothetical protein BDD12DRAFT_882254 [Trichophaea hybrida]
MNEHNDLFKHKQTNSGTILDIALRTGAGTVTTGQGGRSKRTVDLAEFFIDNYPDQTAYLIRQNTSLVHQIIPYLRSCDRTVSPMLFEPSKGMLKFGNQPSDFIDAQYNLVKLILESRPDILKVVNADRRSATGIVLKKKIHFDLVELEFSSYPAPETGLRSLIKGLKFENILQYVEIPRNLFPGEDKEANSTNDVVNNESGLARKEFKMVFDVLGKKGVQKIIDLIVDDDEDTPHSDEVIEELKQFEIGEWD